MMHDGRKVRAGPGTLLYAAGMATHQEPPTPALITDYGGNNDGDINRIKQYMNSGCM